EAHRIEIGEVVADRVNSGSCRAESGKSSYKRAERHNSLLILHAGPDGSGVPVLLMRLDSHSPPLRYQYVHRPTGAKIQTTPQIPGGGAANLGCRNGARGPQKSG